jgi:hypothetical protein
MTEEKRIKEGKHYLVYIKKKCREKCPACKTKIIKVEVYHELPCGHRLLKKERGFYWCPCCRQKLEVTYG